MPFENKTYSFGIFVFADGKLANQAGDSTLELERLSRAANFQDLLTLLDDTTKCAFRESGKYKVVLIAKTQSRCNQEFLFLVWLALQMVTHTSFSLDNVIRMCCYTIVPWRICFAIRCLFVILFYICLAGFYVAEAIFYLTFGLFLRFGTPLGILLYVIPYWANVFESFTL